MGNMKNQLDSAVCACYRPGDGEGGKKYELKKDNAIEHQIFGKLHYKAMRNFARNFGEWLKENFPEYRYAKDIPGFVCNKYLDSKADTNNDRSLKKLKSYMCKLQACVNYHFGTANVDWKSELVVPESRKTESISDRLNGCISKEDVVKIRDACNTQLKKDVVTIAEGTGERGEGVAHMTVEMYRPDIPGEFGFGQVHLYTIDENGRRKGIEKGGRPRIINILTVEAKHAFDRQTEGKVSGDKIIPRAIRTISGYINDAMVKAGVKELYKNVAVHGFRKRFGQDLYDHNVSQGIDRTENIRRCNLALGHGEDRGEEGIRPYIDAYHY